MRSKTNLISGNKLNKMKLLIDLNKYREYEAKNNHNVNVPDGTLNGILNKNGRKSIRELAVFTYSCRRCKDAPCVSVCREEALKKDENGMIVRSSYRCVACKSCVSICPFGTMMTDFYDYKINSDRYFNLNDPVEKMRFVKESPDGLISITEKEKDEEQSIFELLPGILVKDIPWDDLKINGE
jgi:Fe-S-cluster-containing hydrogenase component 2